MLQQLLNSSAQPFRATPDSRFYFDHSSIESARQTILRAIVRSEGPVVVMGGSGYGKTLLAELIGEQLGQRLDVVTLQSARLNSRRSLLQNILFGLQLPYRDMSEGELRLSILDRLEPSPETAPEGVLVIVDEAHTLHWKLLDELRLISNFTRNHQPRVKLLVLGNMRLEETLTIPQLESFNQRLAARCYLQPMNRSETIAFVQHQLQTCQVDPVAVITHDALQSVYSASQGIPRLVNQLMNHALWMASNSAQTPISASLINDAWSDLQQLPTPWSTGKTDQSAPTSVIEFGELSDDGDETDAMATDQPKNVFEYAWSSSAANEAAANPVATLAQSENNSQLLSDSSLSSEPLDIDCIAAEVADDEAHGTNFFAAFDEPAAFEPELECVDTAGQARDAQPAMEIDEPAVSVQSYHETGETALPALTHIPSADFNWFENQFSPVPIISFDDETTQETADERERIGGLMAEQQQYDAMGVWENDPPLSIHKPDKVPSVRPASTPQNLFGSDFDEEVALGPETNKQIKSDSRSIEQSAPIAADDSVDTLAQAASTPSELSADYIARLQQYTEALASVTYRESAGGAAQATTPDLAVQAERSAFEDGTLWSIDVIPTSVGNVTVEEAIEDMVSQLNFSAFSVEPFSVEQIPLEANPSSVPHDSIRRGNNDEVYLMHRPKAMTENPYAALPMDDDRDLLIVEEQVPTSARSTESPAADKPTKNTTPYVQLFARLRK